MKRLVKSILHRVGLDLVRTDRSSVAMTFGQENARIIQEVESFTATSPERVDALVEAVRYVIRAGIPGALVECGTWKGGSMMAVAYRLAELGVTDRDLFLYDTFAGMPAPGEHDVDHTGRPADEGFRERQKGTDDSDW
jgi:hypothetical protein